MKKQDLVTILITFLCGIIAGGYLYVMGFKPQIAQVASELIPPPDPAKIITIEGYQYGGCERSGRCASFKIQDNGEYSYLETSVPTARGTYSGTLARRDWQQIRSRLTEERLVSNSLAVQPETCASDYDLIDYRYQIQFQGESYRLDTCGTDFSRESDLGAALDWLWQFFISDIDER